MLYIKTEVDCGSRRTTFIRIRLLKRRKTETHMHIQNLKQKSQNKTYNRKNNTYC